MPENSTEPWSWTTIASPRGTALPVNVVDRLRWYRRNSVRNRVTFYSVNSAVIVLAAAIPAVSAVGAGAAVAGVLGAVVAILTGLNSLLQSRENWLRSARGMLLIQREIVQWSNGKGDYAGTDADAVLADKVESFVETESTEWVLARSVDKSART
ncbi:DUF4231 domain-containing protein [Flindersiella endophytica]